MLSSTLCAPPTPCYCVLSCCPLTVLCLRSSSRYSQPHALAMLACSMPASPSLPSTPATKHLSSCSRLPHAGRPLPLMLPPCSACHLLTVRCLLLRHHTLAMIVRPDTARHSFAMLAYSILPPSFPKAAMSRWFSRAFAHYGPHA